MIQSLPYRTTTSYFLVIVLVCFYSCIGCNKHTDQSPAFNFAEIKGQVSEQNQLNTIRRWFFIGTDGRKAAISEIVSVTDLSGHKSSETRFINEYLYNDTLSIFDSGDSTCIRLSMANADFSELNLLPLSASWLFFNPGNSENNSADTLTVCGYSCKKKKIDNGFLWIFGTNTMAIESVGPAKSHTERIIKIVNDTIFPKEIFNHPLGYRELVPAHGIAF